jgi:uncharacterized protein (DUF2062 family)
LGDTAHRTALAFALGVYIAFFPIWGIHTAMALGLAFLLKMNRAAVVMGAWINNPWTVVPLYSAGTLLGCLLLGVDAQGLRQCDWRLHDNFFQGLLAGLRPYLWPFVIGNTLLGVAAGAVAYLVLRFILERRAPALARS